MGETPYTAEDPFNAETIEEALLIKHSNSGVKLRMAGEGNLSRGAAVRCSVAKLFKNPHFAVTSQHLSLIFSAYILNATITFRILDIESRDANTTEFNDLSVRGNDKK